jgi:hypothetical protein
MFKIFKLFIVLTVVVCLFDSCSRSASNNGSSTTPGNGEPKHVTSVGVVKASPQPATIEHGGSGNATVSITIQNGYHVNANPATFPYLKATVLDVSPAEDVSAGPVKYPSGQEKQFVFADKPLSVYEGTIALQVPLKGESKAQPGPRSLSAHLHVQACDEQVCYPPGTIDLTIPIEVK